MIASETSNPGHYEDSNSTSGESPCPLGTWQDQPNQTTCMPADAGHYVNTSGKGVVSVAMTSGGSCVVDDQSLTRCWGYGVGDGTYDFRLSPVQSSLPNGSASEKVFAGPTGTCSLLVNGSLYCWGSYVPDTSSITGWATTTDSLVPTEIAFPSGSDIIEVSIGNYHRCALLANGSVYCWGGGYHLGLSSDPSNGSWQESFEPIQMALPDGGVATTVYAGIRSFVCNHGQWFCLLLGAQP